jgi:hypothetical protein
VLLEEIGSCLDDKARRRLHNRSERYSGRIGWWLICGVRIVLRVCSARIGGGLCGILRKVWRVDVGGLGMGSFGYRGS